MKVVVDAHGGDKAPLEVVKGSCMAVKELGVSIILVGKESTILDIVKAENLSLDNIEIRNTEEVITMEDDPHDIIRGKKNSSLAVCMELLKDKQADALVSAGSTGALLIGSTLILKRIKGIRRAALAPVLPTAKGGAMLIDCGANVECTPEYLLQFAYMGSFYMTKMFGIEKPRVGLLNNGTEEEKGTPLQIEAYKLLKKASEEGRINFFGNIEGRDVNSGCVDVVVADGFTGNVLLKTIEGIGGFFVSELKSMFMSSFLTKLAALTLKKQLSSFKKKLDYTEYGGAPLMGISSVVVKAHGSSNAKAFMHAIRQAKIFYESNIISDIVENIEHMRISEET